jgi:hypothetical protein
MALDGRYAARGGDRDPDDAKGRLAPRKSKPASRGFGHRRPDGSMLVGSANGPSIDSLSPDGRRLLAPADDPGAEVVAPGDLGPSSPVRLPDQRVVFVSTRLTASARRCWTAAGPSFLGDRGENPVRFTGGAPVTYPDPREPIDQIRRRARLPAMQPLGPGPWDG